VNEKSNVTESPVAEAINQMKEGGDPMKAVVWAHLAIADAINNLAYEVARVGIEGHPINVAVD
jgi:hypothetical protein